MSKRAEEKLCEACCRHYNKTPDECGNTEREMQWDCPYFDFIERGYELAEKDLGWHSVDESLPPIDEEVIVLAKREVIVLTNRMHGKELPYVRCICFAHRPNPNGWDGKDFETGEVKHYDVATYDGWNIPGVKFWMPCPKLPEE